MVVKKMLSLRGPTLKKSFWGPTYKFFLHSRTNSISTLDPSIYMSVCLFSLAPKIWQRQRCHQSCLSVCYALASMGHCTYPPPVLSLSLLSPGTKGFFTHPNPLSKGTCSTGFEMGCKPVLFSWKWDC